MRTSRGMKEAKKTKNSNRQLPRMDGVYRVSIRRSLPILLLYRRQTDTAPDSELSSLWDPVKASRIQLRALSGLD